METLGELSAKLRARGLSVVLAGDPESAVLRARENRLNAALIGAELFDETRSRLAADSELSALTCLILDNAVSDSDNGVFGRRDAEGIARHIYALAVEPVVEARAGGDFRGDLAQVGLGDLLQLLSMNHRTGVVAVSTSSGEAEVRVDNGEVVDAIYRRLEGEKALFRLLGENRGRFAFTQSHGPMLRRLQASTPELLIDGARQLDELNARLRTLALGDDALLSVSPPDGLDALGAHRVAEALLQPKSTAELMDEVSLSDLAVINELEGLIASGRVRRIPGGGAKVEFADPDRLNMLAAQVKQLERPGFPGSTRMLLAGSPEQMVALGHALRRIANAVPPPRAAPAIHVPQMLGSLRLGEIAELHVIGLPLLEAYSPVWTLALPGSAVVVLLSGGESSLVSRACQLTNVPLFEAAELVGDLDETNPAQLADLIRNAIRVAAGS
jgi:hypothetical protein